MSPGCTAEGPAQGRAAWRQILACNVARLLGSQGETPRRGTGGAQIRPTFSRLAKPPAPLLPPGVAVMSADIRHEGEWAPVKSQGGDRANRKVYRRSPTSQVPGRRIFREHS
jgi:hypothetical protein